MTLVFGQPQPVNQPQTHTLIIGVGRYTYLHGGAGHRKDDVPLLSQLTSPPLSARAFAEWFTGTGQPGSARHYNPEAPLGSVELLLSGTNEQPYPTAAGQVKIESATMDLISTRFNEWDSRCDAHADNVGIFYYCGHGLQKENLILLPEDFASNPKNPWMTAIDFERTYRGMAGCKAKTQYYVIDCCREWSRNLLLDLDVEGHTLKRGKVNQQSEPRTAAKLYGSTPGLQAFGDTQGVSRLTTALLECLNGSGADKRNGRWVVHTTSLGEAVHKLFKERNKALDPEDRQDINPSSADYDGVRVLHRLPQGSIPLVTVVFRCDIEAATAEAEFWAKRGQAETHAEKAGPASLDLEAGTWDFGAAFPNGRYRATPVEGEFLKPPTWEITLPIETEVQHG